MPGIRIPFLLCLVLVLVSIVSNLFGIEFGIRIDFKIALCLVWEFPFFCVCHQFWYQTLLVSNFVSKLLCAWYQNSFLFFVQYPILYWNTNTTSCAIVFKLFCASLDLLLACFFIGLKLLEFILDFILGLFALRNLLVNKWLSSKMDLGSYSYNSLIHMFLSFSFY